MYLATVILLTAASSLVVAQTATDSAPAGVFTCAAQAVLDQCIQTEQAQVNACVSDDYACLCQQYTNLLTCYNNCPADQGVFGVSQDKTQYCEAAAAYGTTTLMVASSTMVTPDSSTATAEVISGFAAATSVGSSEPTKTPLSSSGDKLGGAPAVGVPVVAGLVTLIAAGFAVILL